VTPVQTAPFALQKSSHVVVGIAFVIGGVTVKHERPPARKGALVVADGVVSQAVTMRIDTRIIKYLSRKNPHFCDSPKSHIGLSRFVY
jgi:hypothetical protein